MVSRSQGFRRAAQALFALSAFAASQVLAGDTALRYPETAAVLSDVYQRETRARAGYEDCSRQARFEGYPNIAYLFSSLSASETIHAANFRRILAAIGREAQEPPPATDAPRKTRENLKSACDRELEEINESYPSLLEQVRPEGHEESMRFITYAWESEKQHRDLLNEIKSGTGFFFGTLARRVEGKQLNFLVCTTCGSTVDERPKERCPICGAPPSVYEELKKAP